MNERKKRKRERERKREEREREERVRERYQNIIIKDKKKKFDKKNVKKMGHKVNRLISFKSKNSSFYPEWRRFHELISYKDGVNHFVMIFKLQNYNQILEHLSF